MGEMNDHTTTEVAVAESKLRDAKRVAIQAFTSRTDNLHLIRAKQSGRILAINRHMKSLEDTRNELQTLRHDSKYGNIDSYVADERVDDFLGHMMLKHKLQQVTERVANLERTQSTAQDIWDAQVQHLEPHHIATLAVLNYASGNIDENFRIDPERCKCGRIFHFNATLSMNFCTVHKVYFPILNADDKSTKKPKQSPGNYTNTNSMQHNGKAHRLVITSENQICAANNLLYKDQLQSSQKRVDQSAHELRIKLVKKEEAAARRAAIQRMKPKQKPKPKPKPKPQSAPRTQHTKKPQPDLSTKATTPTRVAKTKKTQQPKPPKQPKEPKKRMTKIARATSATTVKKTNQSTIETTLAKQKARLSHHTPSPPITTSIPSVSTTLGSKRKQSQSLHSSPSLLQATPQPTPQKPHGTLIVPTLPNAPQPMQKKQQLQVHKNIANYECYLLQFAPDAQEITSDMLQQIHAVVSTVAIFGEARCLQEITTLVETSVAFCDVRTHVQRILKLSRAQPVPVIDTALRQRLIARYREVQNVLSSWQQGGCSDVDASSKSRRRFAPCNESLTHVFLLGETEWHLAGAFAAHSTLKVELDHVQRFRELIQTVARSSTFVWKYDFDLIVDKHNNRAH